MTFEDGKKAIARIYSAGGEVAGVGFLVADRYVLTCAHVVAASVEFTDSPIGSAISIALPFATSEQRHPTQVVSYDYDSTSSGNDFAILQLMTAPGKAIQPIYLASLPLTDRSLDLEVFGFPKGDETGRNLTAVMRGRVVGDWEQIEDTKQPGLAIEEGFSGAPVWCRALNAFVGMVVARDSKRPEAKVGFMIPTDKLGRPLRVVQRQSLFDILELEQQRLSEQIAIAYRVCRPLDRPKPYQTQLNGILEDLSDMSAGQFAEPMLVQFVASLLNQRLPEPINQLLKRWAERYTTNLNSLQVQLLEKQNRTQLQQRSSAEQQEQPCLLVNVKPHEAKAQYYYVSAWWIPDADRYDATTGEGAEKLEIQDICRYVEAEDLNPEAGIPCDKIAVVLADYLDQVGVWIDIQHLTVELLLPYALMNEPLEQRSIPVEFGFPQALAKVCHVVVRSQERLEAGRFLKRWQTKWQRVEASYYTCAGSLFVAGSENLRQLQTQLASDDKLGLRLTASPKTNNQGELGVLIGTGTPIALWVRQENPSTDWAPRLAQQVFCCLDQTNQNASEGQTGCCLEPHFVAVSEGQRVCCRSILLGALPEQVSTVRQNAPDMDEDSRIDQSLELGHHLSFLWEDPKRVPPKITYSNKAL